MKTEYVRNINRNYLRVMPDSVPDHKRYQYCILNRGGLKYLLPCQFQSVNGEGYLDYEISSSQNVRQVFAGKSIRREWMEEFLWGMQKMRQELTRFLLDERNIVWNPEYIFQDLEKNDFQFLYLPYAGQEGLLKDNFEHLLEFWVEKIDYNDEPLSEFVYQVYEQFLSGGEAYLEKQIFEDFKKISELSMTSTALKDPLSPENKAAEPLIEKATAEEEKGETQAREKVRTFFGGRKRKQEQKNSYREEMRRMINGYAVCEEHAYEALSTKEDNEVSGEEYGRTIYIEETAESVRGLYTEKGAVVVRLVKFPFVVGKRKEDADYVLTDYSASRVHARFIEEEDGIYLEDLNSTNGTFKNGLRMQPYEKRKLEPEDILRFGKSSYVFK